MDLYFSSYVFNIQYYVFCHNKEDICKKRQQKNNIYSRKTTTTKDGETGSMEVLGTSRGSPHLRQTVGSNMYKGNSAPLNVKGTKNADTAIVAEVSTHHGEYKGHNRS